MNGLSKMFALALLLSAAAATTAHAGLSEDADGVLHCSGKGSCASLKQACENGHATYEDTGGNTGTCTVGSTVGGVGQLKAAQASPARERSVGKTVFGSGAARGTVAVDSSGQ